MAPDSRLLASSFPCLMMLKKKNLKPEENKNNLGEGWLLNTHLHFKCVLGRERSVGKLQKGFESVSSTASVEGELPHEVHTGLCVFTFCLKRSFASAPEKLITDITDRPCLPLAKLSP